MRRYLVQRLPWPMDPGGFIVCYSQRFMFVPVSKNASTSLKRLVFRLDIDPAGLTEGDIHERLGYRLDGHRRLSLDQARARRFDGFLRFAVWRDPVERLCSYYDNQVAPWRGRHSEYLRRVGMIGADFPAFLRFARRELSKAAPRSQDQHLRRASDEYQPDDLDFIVPIELLSAFLRARVGVSLAGERANHTQRRTRPTPAQRALIRRLYRPDYHLLGSGKLAGVG